MKFAVLLALTLAFGLTAARAAEYPKMGDDIFDPQASGQELVNAAVARAAIEHKRVLIDFGANWCIWCHRLHHTFEASPEVAKLLSEHFIVVMVDVNHRIHPDRNRDVIAKYDPKLSGIPELVVLDDAGKELTIKDSGELEEGDHHSPAKIAAFLAQWTPASGS